MCAYSSHLDLLCGPPVPGIVAALSTQFTLKTYLEEEQYTRNMETMADDEFKVDVIQCSIVDLQKGVPPWFFVERLTVFQSRQACLPNIVTMTHYGPRIG